jgi:hypothetical protein
MDDAQQAPSGVNPADDAAIDEAKQAEAQVESNRRTVTADAQAALDVLAQIVGADDAAVAANVGAHIKTLARVLRLILRIQLGRFEGTT